MKFHCKICDNTFKKFVLFEGHFDFNAICREKHGCFLQCYMCSQEFRHSAALEYHLQQHKHTKYHNLLVDKSKLVVPKITLKKQWHFKVVPQVDEDDSCDESESQQLECKICKKIFRSSSNLKRHLLKHQKKRIPNLTSTVASNVPLKTSKLLPLQTNQCSICKIRLKNSFNMARHMKAHTKGRVACKICNIKFSSQLLHWHNNRFHRNNVTALKCKTCDASFSNRTTLGTHEKMHTEGSEICKICNIRFTPNYLGWHIKLKHLETIKSSDNICKICRAPIKPHRLPQHMLAHKHGKIECEECNIRFTQTTLYWHRKRFHPHIDHRFLARECQICKATFSSGCSLRRHLKVHDIGEVKCELCQIRFTAGSLIKHEKKFHPDLPHTIFIKQPCPVCKAICSSRYALDVHAEMHRDGKFDCEKCNIKFTFEELQIHNKRHHRQSASCPICKLKLAKSFYLEQHMKVHTVGNVTCDICHIRFTPCSLIYHRKIFHPHIDYRVPHSVKAMRQKQRRDRERLKKNSQFLRCKLCKVLCADAKRLEIHENVHIDADTECRVCKVPFKKRSLVMHERRFHPEIERKDRIMKALRRHIADELSTLNEREAMEIPIILEDQYNQLLAESKCPHQCIICKLPCAEAMKLDAHIKVHIEGEYKCEICKVWFTKNSLDFHQRRYHTEFYEERMLNGIRLMKEHEDGKENEHTEKKTKNLNSICDICHVQCGDATEKMDEHKRMHIIGDVKCEVCNIRFTVASLRYHLKRFHPEMPRPPRVVSTLKCDICKLNCSDAKRLEVHMTVHTQADTKCEICNIPFTKAALLYHVRRFHGNFHKSDTDAIVAKALGRHNLVERMAIEQRSDESNGQQYPCVICKILCADQKIFHQHVKVHAYGDVKCEVCQIWFTRASLDYHYKRFHPDLNVGRETKVQFPQQCQVCKLACSDEGRLKEHVKVHLGNMKCEICNIRFTKASLIYHYKRSHPNVPKENFILKAIENYASKKSLHDCKICGKSFTRICYLKLHQKTHRNGTESIEIPFASDTQFSDECQPAETHPAEPHPAEPHPAECIPTECLPTQPHPDESLPTESQNLDSYQIDIPTDTSRYDCYVCDASFPTDSQLRDHLSGHLNNQHWIDPVEPFNIYLSNRSAEEYKEIISRQPMVMVDKLDMSNVNMKSLAYFGQPKQTRIEELQQQNETLPETDLQNAMPVANSCTIEPDTTQTHCEEIFEIMSDSDEDCETIQHQLNNNAWLRLKPEPSSMQPVCANESVDNGVTYISSDDEDITDITESYHCYFCNWRFRTLRELGDHEKYCNLKFEN